MQVLAIRCGYRHLRGQMTTWTIKGAVSSRNIPYLLLPPLKASTEECPEEEEGAEDPPLLGAGEVVVEGEEQASCSERVSILGRYPGRVGTQRLHAENRVAASQRMRPPSPDGRCNVSLEIVVRCE